MVKVFADSTCDLPVDLQEKYDVKIVPLYILLGIEEHKDGVDITPAQIFEWSDANKTTPTTSAVSIGDALDALEPVVEAGDEAVVFTLSKSMSNTFNAFNMAVSELEAQDKIYVIDCKNISVASGLLVIEGALMAKAGKSAAEIAERMIELRKKVRASFVVDTLTYLARGGRCSSVSSIAGGVLKLHPRIVVNDGVLSADKKYRGKMSAVIQSYFDDLKDDLLRARRDRVYLVHANCAPEIVAEVRRQLENLYKFDEVLETVAGSVISSHCGPGTLGIMYIAE